MPLMPSDEIQLLRDYAKTRSQDAFAMLVERYVGLVYSAARRQCRGDAHLAEDVTQAVFIILAEKAATVPADRPLSAWLLKTCAYCAANARRSKTHRQHHERRAAQMAQIEQATHSADDHDATWEDLSPLLDEGMNRLRPQDRNALLLKFFDKKSMRQIGEALGISEEAAGKRVARAVDRLRDFFRRHGVAVSAAALPVLLLGNASHAAPAGMVSAVVTSAATTAATTTSSAAAVAKGALAVMAAEKAKLIALAAAAIVVGVGATAVVIKTIAAPVSAANHQLAAVTPIAAPTTSPTSSAWPIRLPDGTVIEILGISDDALAPSPWWTLDGTIIPAPAKPDGALVTIPQAAGSRRIMILARFIGVAPQAPRTMELRPRLSGGTTATSDRGGGGGGPAGILTRHVTLVAAQQATADLILGVGVSGQQQQVEVRGVSLVPGRKSIVQVVARPAPAEQATARR